MEQIDRSELYSQRLIILLETGPQTSKYNQVILNAKQFKKVSNLISTFCEKVADADKFGIEELRVPISEQEYPFNFEVNDFAT